MINVQSSCVRSSEELSKGEVMAPKPNFEIPSDHHHHHHHHHHQVAIVENVTAKNENIKQQNGFKKQSNKWTKIGYALNYAATSVIIMSVNKIVLTSWGFPSPTVLVVGQILAILIVLSIAKRMGLVDFPEISRRALVKLQPLPIFYLANAVTGLGGTKELSLPMFTAVRRFGILITLLGEYFLLGIKSSLGVHVSVGVMLTGAFVATFNDIKFTLRGYSMVMLNNFFTSTEGLLVKHKVTTTEFGSYGLLYYNALFNVVPAIGIAYSFGEIDKAINFPDWNDLRFVACFLLSCFLGLALQWSAVECTNHNSPLTTVIVGTMKNILITYVGMFIGGDYVLELFNFCGINISVVGSLIYLYVCHRQK